MSDLTVGFMGLSKHIDYVMKVSHFGKYNILCVGSSISECSIRIIDYQAIARHHESQREIIENHTLKYKVFRVLNEHMRNVNDY